MNQGLEHKGVFIKIGDPEKTKIIRQRINMSQDISVNEKDHIDCIASLVKV